MPKMRLLRSSRGFTLVEAMVVIGIVGIMACVSYSGFSPLLKREKVTAAANQLMGHIKEAKMLSLEKHVSHALDINGTTYTIYRDANNSCTLDANESIVHQVNIAQDFPGVTMSGTTQLRFDTRGMPRSSTGGLGLAGITFTLSGKRTCTLTVSSAGRIDVISCQDL
jgi:type IV fimbrial biogenesis protein FimT